MRNLKLVNFVAIAAGSAIMGFGINYFNIANSLAEGGVTGLSIVLKLAFDWDPGLTSLLINLPLLALGWKILGRHSIIYTIWGTGCLSLFLWVFGMFRFPMDDLLLASLFAGVTVGVGLGIIFRFGGTTGGVDIIARIFHKYFGWKMGRTMFIADLVVIAISLTHLSLQQAMYTVVAVFVGTRIIDVVQEAAYSARALTIVSDKSEEITKVIMRELNRGVTMMHGEGAYTGASKKIAYVVVGKSEIVKTKNIVLGIDPGAFISVGVASEVLGEGFTLDQHKKPIAV